MLQDSLATRLFIRVSIFSLRAIAPLSVLYCSFRIAAPKYLPSNIGIRALDVYAGAESLFYLLVYIPRRIWLDRAAPPCSLLHSREERQEAFLKTWECTPDPHSYVSLWFKGVPVEALCREDVKDWLHWRMWNQIERSLANEPELDGYCEQTEQILDHTFPKGHSGNSSMAVTFEPLQAMHRPLIWYTNIVGGADLYTSLSLMWTGYRCYRLPLRRFFSSLPIRPLSLLTRNCSPSTHMPYWYLPHTSKEYLPVVFIHGIGVGLYAYISFLQDFEQQFHRRLGVGMIALEILPISSRISPPFLHGPEMAREIQAILQKHNWSRCIVVSHSYGSVICTHLLRNPVTAPMIGPLLFVDPVTFSFHDPHVAWNFLRRKPKTASEIQLQYFASTDQDVAHTLTRRFVWPENSLWREEVEERVDTNEQDKCTVALSGKDIITETNNMGRYLTRDQRRRKQVKWYQEDDRMNEDWKCKDWSGDEALEVIWYPELNHAEVFYEKEDRDRLMTVIGKYSVKQSPQSNGVEVIA